MTGIRIFIWALTVAAVSIFGYEVAHRCGASGLAAGAVGVLAGAGLSEVLMRALDIWHELFSTKG